MITLRTHRIAPALAFLGAAAIAGCTQEPPAPTFGERLSTQGSAVSALGAQWTRGEQMIVEGRALIEDGREDVDEGERLVSRGEKRIKAGRQEIRQGKRMVTEGKEMKREAEEAYEARPDDSATQG